MPKFERTYCSQCGATFGPGNRGFSMCREHRRAASPLTTQEICRSITLRSEKIGGEIDCLLSELRLLETDAPVDSEGREFAEDCVAWAEGVRDHFEDKPSGMVEIECEGDLRPPTVLPERFVAVERRAG